ncbi:MAG: hypothetical protein MHM6MM_001280 [Cercozoa sp. M6MM]
MSGELANDFSTASRHLRFALRHSKRKDTELETQTLRQNSGQKQKQSDDVIERPPFLTDVSAPTASNTRTYERKVRSRTADKGKYLSNSLESERRKVWSTTESELTRLANLNESLSSEVASLRDQLAKAEARATSVERSAAEQRAEMARITDELQRSRQLHTHELEHMQQQVRLAAEKTRSLATENNELHKELEATQSCVQQIRCETDEARRQLSAQHAAHRSALADADEAERLLERGRVQLRERTAELTKTRQQRDELQFSVQQLEQRLVQITEATHRAEERMAMIAKERNEVQQRDAEEKASLRQQLEEAQRATAHFQAQAKRVSDEAEDAVARERDQLAQQLGDERQLWQQRLLSQQESAERNRIDAAKAHELELVRARRALDECVAAAKLEAQRNEALAQEQLANLQQDTARKLSERDRQIRDLTDQVEPLQLENTQLRSDLDELQRRVELELRALESDFRQQITLKTAEAAHASAQQERFEQTLREKVKELSDERDAIKRAAERQILASRAEAEHAMKISQIREKEAANAMEHLRDVQTAQSALQREVTTLREQCEQLTSNTCELKHRNGELQSELNSWRSRTQELENIASELNTSARRELDSAEVQLQELRRALQKETAEKNKLRRHVTKHRDESKELGKLGSTFTPAAESTSVKHRVKKRRSKRKKRSSRKKKHRSAKHSKHQHLNLTHSDQRHGQEDSEVNFATTAHLAHRSRHRFVAAKTGAT